MIKPKDLKEFLEEQIELWTAAENIIYPSEQGLVKIPFMEFHDPIGKIKKVLEAL